MGRRCSPKQGILAAFAGIMVSTVVISVISVVLRPGKIHFSVTHAYNASSDAGGATMQLNLTISANNTSYRAGVRYHSVAVSLQYTSPAPSSTNYSIPAKVTREAWSQPPGSTRSISASASMSSDDWKTDFDEPARGNSEDGMVTTAAATLIKVLVVTIVQFKIGPVYTSPYHVRVLCDPVDYFFSRRSLANTSISCSDA